MGTNGIISALCKIGLGIFGGYIIIMLIISLVVVGFIIKIIIDLLNN